MFDQYYIYSPGALLVEYDWQGRELRQIPLGPESHSRITRWLYGRLVGLPEKYANLAEPMWNKGVITEVIEDGKSS